MSSYSLTVVQLGDVAWLMLAPLVAESARAERGARGGAGGLDRGVAARAVRLALGPHLGDARAALRRAERRAHARAHGLRLRALVREPIERRDALRREPVRGRE